MIALVTGLVSVYSSTSGVVLPAFLPSVPGLVEKLGGGDPLAIASSILVGGHLVDVSPLSTIGALCVAGAAAGEDRRLLFNRVLAWGLSMAVVGAVLLLRGLRAVAAGAGADRRDRGCAGFATRRPGGQLTADRRQRGPARGPPAPGRGTRPGLADARPARHAHARRTSSRPPHAPCATAGPATRTTRASPACARRWPRSWPATTACDYDPDREILDHRRGDPRPLHRPGRPGRAGRRRPAARPDLRRLRLADRPLGRPARGRPRRDPRPAGSPSAAPTSRRAARPGTRVVLLNTPWNPVGTVLTRDGAPGRDGLRRGARPRRHQRRDLRDARLRRPAPPVAGRAVGGRPGADACSSTACRRPTP